MILCLMRMSLALNEHTNNFGDLFPFYLYIIKKKKP
jgi:hypothetical protein